MCATTTRRSDVESPLQFTPFHAAGVLFLAVGLAFGVYRGAMAFDLVPPASWVTWSHIHFVTIGGFTQVLLGTMPQLAARKLGRPTPSRRTLRASFLALNGAFLLVWYGRAFGGAVPFDVGLAAIWLVILGLFLTLLKMALQSDGRAWDPTIGLYLLSTFVFLWGIVYAVGLFGHFWAVPGGWHGIREGHVHANAWGFLGLAVVGTLYDLFPSLVGAELHSDRLKGYSFWLFAAGIFPLITGPILDMGRTVTTPGLALYGAGFLLFAYNLARTYRRGTSSGVARSILAAQAWLLGPAVFAPFLLFGLPLGIDGAWVEQGALHFFFVGWALPVALGGLLVYVRSLSHPGDGTTGSSASVDRLPSGGNAPRGISAATVAVWNVSVLAVGIGFFFQDRPFAATLQGVGFTVLILVWAYQLGLIVRARLSVRTAPVGA